MRDMVTLHNIVCLRCGYQIRKKYEVEEAELPLQMVCSRCNAMVYVKIDENGRTVTSSHDFF